ncbi:hypothetical protein ACVWXL_001876 [Bradyrhizobium sp. GM22.5]
MAALVQQRVSDLVVRQAHGRLQIDIVGQHMNGVRRRDHIVGVAAAALRQVACAQQHLLADRKPLDAGPERGDAAGDVVARIGRQWRHPFVDATPDQHIGLPNAAERFGANLHLAWSGHRHRKLNQFECIRPTRLTHQHRSHDVTRLPSHIFENHTVYENYCKMVVGAAC